MVYQVICFKCDEAKEILCLPMFTHKIDRLDALSTAHTKRLRAEHKERMRLLSKLKLVTEGQIPGSLVLLILNF